MERLLHQDGIVRLLSVLLALILWFNVSGTQSVEGEKVLPIRLRVSSTAPGMQMLNEPQQVVEVKVKGPKRDLAAIKAENLEARLDLQGYTESGQYLVPVKVYGLADKELQWTVEPAQVLVTLERQMTREFPPLLPDSERVTENLKIQAVLKEKENVKVSGLQRDVSKVARVEARVDMSGITESTELPAHLVALDAAGVEVANVDLKPRTLMAQVQVFRLPPAKEVPVQPKFSGRMPEGYTLSSVSVEPATVRVRGPQERHKEWVEVATQPIDLSGQKAPFTVQAALVRPAGANSLDREYVTITINITEQRVDQVFTKVKLDLWHLAANLEAQRAVQDVTVRLYGPKAALDAFKPESLGLHLELENLGPGKYTLPVLYNKPQGLEVRSIDPPAVEVTITEKKP